MIQQIKGGVTAAKGFAAAATAAGIKYQDRDDMALIYSKVPCHIAGTFTRNIVKAAPVLWDQEVVKRGQAQAVVINAGIANAGTGKEGFKACEETAAMLGAALGLSPQHMLVASTGVIGMQLPLDRLGAGINAMVPALAETLESGHRAAQAIMTTDTHEKEIAIQFTLDGKTITMGGMAKGSGMIHPNMGTMLSFITTDVCISQSLLQEALLADVEDTYNMISVDGDTSTNDTCLVLANGLAGNAEITEKGEAYTIFCQALRTVNEYLAKQLAGDGEGATKLLEVTVHGALTKAQAKTLSKSVITSNLTKAAMYGRDANWGRILCAMGYSGADFDQELVSLSFESAAGHILIAENGVAVDFNEEAATAILSEAVVKVDVDLHLGSESATAWGCDLTHRYVDINADYRS